MAPPRRSGRGISWGGVPMTHTPPLERWLAGLEVSQGAHAGQPFAVLPWERRFVRGAFRPGVRDAALTIARGNGKTALVAGLATAYLDGPLVARRGEVTIVASSFDQSRIAFEHVLAFMGDRIVPAAGALATPGQRPTGR